MSTWQRRPARWSTASPARDIAVTNKVPIRAEHLNELPHLKMISVAATGYDVIDVAACRERGIVVSNVRGYAVNTVPEHTFALILALRRSIVGYRQDVIDGSGRRPGSSASSRTRSGDLAGSTLGIMGEGAIGQSVAQHRPGLRHAHAVRRPQGRERPRPALHAVRRGAGDQRRDHAALPAARPPRAA